MDTVIDSAIMAGLVAAAGACLLVGLTGVAVIGTEVASRFTRWRNRPRAWARRHPDGSVSLTVDPRSLVPDTAYDVRWDPANGIRIAPVPRRIPSGSFEQTWEDPQVRQYEEAVRQDDRAAPMAIGNVGSILGPGAFVDEWVRNAPPGTVRSLIGDQRMETSDLGDHWRTVQRMIDGVWTETNEPPVLGAGLEPSPAETAELLRAAGQILRETPARPDPEEGLPPVITREWLQRHRACDDGIRSFMAVFPDGMAPVNLESLDRAYEAGLNWAWLMETFPRALQQRYIRASAVWEARLRRDVEVARGAYRARERDWLAQHVVARYGTTLRTRPAPDAVNQAAADARTAQHDASGTPADGHTALQADRIVAPPDPGAWRWEAGAAADRSSVHAQERQDAQERLDRAAGDGAAWDGIRRERR